MRERHARELGQGLWTSHLHSPLPVLPLLRELRELPDLPDLPDLPEETEAANEPAAGLFVVN